MALQSMLFREKRRTRRETVKVQKENTPLTRGAFLLMRITGLEPFLKVPRIKVLSCLHISWVNSWVNIIECTFRELTTYFYYTHL